MFKLYRITDNEFYIIRGRKSFYGDKVKTIMTLILMGVEEVEIEAGLNALIMNQHNVADYGTNRFFIYSE
jgi:hypothetical protein